MSTQPTVVFIHGAGMGAWVWERVAGDMPVPTLALDVPCRVADTTPASCADALVAELDRRQVGPVVLTLHSLAGVLTSRFAEKLGSRLKSCVFVSAVIPPPGGSFLDTLGFANRLILRVLFKLNRNGLKPSAAMIRRELCNDLAEEDAETVVSRFEAELPGLYLTPVETAPTLTRCAYVKLLDDRSVLPTQQDAMIERLGSCHVHEIDAGHLVMMSQPSALAGILTEEVRRSSPSNGSGDGSSGG